jgi:high-affinity iron transporter
MSSLLGLASLLWGIGLATAQTPSDPTQIIVHMLDYVAVDYPEFVQDGVVLDQSEYDEQREFSQQVRTMLDSLPMHPDKPSLFHLADELISGL